MQAPIVEKNITTKSIVNEMDISVARMEIYQVNKEDETVTARLYDKNENLIEGKRIYSYHGDYKNIPVLLLADEISYLDGCDPDVWWDLDTIKLWMADRQTMDDEGAVSPDDPYFYESDDTKETLLNLTGKASSN